MRIIRWLSVKAANEQISCYVITSAEGKVLNVKSLEIPEHVSTLLESILINLRLAPTPSQQLEYDYLKCKTNSNTVLIIFAPMQND